MSHRNRPCRSPERLRPMAGPRGAPAPLIVELAANAPSYVLAAAEAAVRAVAPLTVVELVRVRAMTLPRGETLRIRVRPHGLRHAAITEALALTGGDLRAVGRYSRHRDLRVLALYDDSRADLAGEVARKVAGSL